MTLPYRLCWKFRRTPELEVIVKSYTSIDPTKNFFTNRIINTWNSLLENIISAKDTKIFEHRLDNYWKDQDLLYNYESKLIIGIEIDEKKELSIVVGGQCSETDL